MVSTLVKSAGIEGFAALNQEASEPMTILIRNVFQLSSLCYQKPFSCVGTFSRFTRYDAPRRGVEGSHAEEWHAFYLKPVGSVAVGSKFFELLTFQCCPPLQQVALAEAHRSPGSLYTKCSNAPVPVIERLGHLYTQ